MICFIILEVAGRMKAGYGDRKRGLKSMEIAAQIRKHRKDNGLSQEDLAKKIFVSRQTVSNWENEKSYPDIHSLLLLSSLFNISVDELIKGDVQVMKQEVDREKIERFNSESAVFTVLLIVSVIAFIPLVVWLKGWGIALWAILFAVVMVYAFRIEKLKKENNIQTYQEILAFSEGKTLDELESAKEQAKRPYQMVLKFLAGAAVGALLAAGAILLLHVKG